MRRLLNIVVATLFMSPLMTPVSAHLKKSFTGGSAVDNLVQDAIADHRLPGAVVVVGHRGRIIFEKAYGNRALIPAVEPMTKDTIFDCASLTKVIATTSSLMKLYDQGKFRLNDPITDYIPEFQRGKSEITIRELMTHFSGLKPDVPLHPIWHGYETGIRLACTDPPETVPGKRHIYSDINFELLGELVQRLTGESLADYARKNIFLPLGMRDTMFNPPKELLPRIAPTEIDDVTGEPFRGVVHDPTARYMGGVAGHAGVFSTAADLSHFAQTMLNEGELNGVRVFSRAAVKKFTEPQTPPNQPVLRGLGWDIDSPYSSNRGELFPIGSYGHTGFTGTSLWIDPFSQSYVIILANAVHPRINKGIVRLRANVATAVAAGLDVRSQRVALTGYNELFLGPGFRRPVYRTAETKTGLDVLEADHFASLQGKRIGLITNQTGLDHQGVRNIDAMVDGGVQLVKLFSPEHGFAGAVDRPGIEDSTDSKTGLPILSLYGKHLRPTPQMLKGVDELVFDIQDAGVRFYTYETTLAYCIEAAGKAGIPLVVLDRPNPITGVRVEGPALDSSNTSFVGVMAGCPVRHGMTVGELALMFNAVKRLKANVQVVKMEDWERGDWFDSLGIGWVNPSPNLRSLKACILYPGICLIEFAKNLSVGRGTDSPFEQIGAEFIDGHRLATYLNKREIPGVRVYPTTFTPTTSNLENQLVHGIRIEIVDREQLDSVRLGIEIACALEHLYPGRIDWKEGRLLIGSDATIRQIEHGADPYSILDTWIDGLQAFGAKRDKFLLYK
jgi:uncharacterized protein YbbC (DUF1343 family)/CubicO group peptidase (beta-lactamase class C family)